MGTSGQNNFTGISAQADITLLYLLKSCKRSDFQKVSIEGKNWEDFALIFDDHNEDFEVKWWKRAVSYNDIKGIIEKELQKSFGEKDKLTIVVKHLSQQFAHDYTYIKNDMYKWYSVYNGDQKEHPLFRKFIEKDWTEDAINFLSKTEIVEFEDENNVNKRIVEYFALEDPFYLSAHDLDNLVAKFFRKILKQGAQGMGISQHDLLTVVGEFKKEIAEKSESFSPEISIRKKVENIKDFLKSQRKFKELNNAKYLSPISDNRRLIFYITDKLEKSRFGIDSFNFFIQKILLKQQYVNLTMRLLETKWKQKKAAPDYLVDFIITHYNELFYDFNYYNVLKILQEISENDSKGKFDDKILKFLQSDILRPFSIERRGSLNEDIERLDWKEEISKLLEIYYQRTPNKKEYIDFLFKYFDFTTDSYDNFYVTPPKIYSVVKRFLLSNADNNFNYVVEKISDQFNSIYKGYYAGYEMVGSGVSQSGFEFTITDLGIVRLIFKPYFEELYNQNKESAWKYFKANILDKGIEKSSLYNPYFLKRALIGILLDRLEDKNLSKESIIEALDYLKRILLFKKGIPSTSEIIFDEIRSRDSFKIGCKTIMDLIKLDSVKNRRKDYSAGFPSTLFVFPALFNLVKVNYEPAKKFFLNLIKKPDFFKKDEWYDSMELLSVSGLPDSDPDFTFQVLRAMNLKNYLNNIQREMVWDKSAVLTGLIKRDWVDGKNRGKKIIERLLSHKNPSEIELEYVGEPIRELAKLNPERTFDLIANYLKDKRIFREKFKHNPYTRQNIVWLAEELAKAHHYSNAKVIIELCIDDPDPITNNRPETFNYHLQVKEGEGQMVISTVRGVIPWVLQQFVLSNQIDLVKYALNSTELLLDLDGSFANKLGYAESDYYVRLQALTPLIILSRKDVRNFIDKRIPGRGKRVKELAFKVACVVEIDIRTNNANPTAILKRLAHVFNVITDLNTGEAKYILEFFEKNKVVDACCLFIHFAVFREREYKNIPFDPIWFKHKLRDLCMSNNVFRNRIAWSFWKIADDDKKGNTNYFDEIEDYWKLMLNNYQEDVYRTFYRILESLLENPDKYESCKRLLMKAIENEINHIMTTNQKFPIWGMGVNIFPKIRDRSETDFLEMFDFLLGKIEGNVSYYGMSKWVELFKSIKPKSRAQKTLCKNICDKLLELYPEYDC